MEYLRTLRKLFFAAAATARKDLFGVGVEREDGLPVLRCGGVSAKDAKTSL